MRNLKVIARNSVDGLYYPGFVTETSEKPRIHVTFFKIQSQEVQREHIITIGGAVPWPGLKVGDHALVEIRCKSMQREFFVPAVVLVLPWNQRFETKFFTVRLYTGQCVAKPRILIVKISPEKYCEILSYIKTIRYGKQIRFPSDPNLHDSSFKTIPNIGQDPSTLKVKYRNRTDITTIKRLTIANNELLKDIQRMKSRPKTSRHRYPKVNRKKSYLSVSYTDGTHSAPQPLYPLQKRFTTSSQLSIAKSASSSSKNHRQVRPNSVMSVNKETQSNISDISVINTLSDPPAEEKHSRNDSSAAKNSSTYSDDTFEKLESSFESTPRCQTAASQRSKTSTTSLDKSGTTNQNKQEKPTPKRKSTPTDGQEVLARWPDDGWYYFGVVVTEVEHETYVVRDNTGNVDTILREDILIEREHSFQVIQPQDRVIALHPRYIFSYAPAVVKAVYNFGVQVEFFDTFTAKLPTSEVFKISAATYRKNIEYIKECEENICSKGGNVVARDDNSGYYIQGKAECPVGKDQQFFISLPQVKYVKQAAIHIFEITTSSGQHRKDKDWHYVLAPVDDYSLNYLPAQIVGRQPFSFSFCDGRQTKADTLKRCFYLSEDYYRLAVNYFINCQSVG